jgi:regulator of sirC expression with transglutaminase-like and TPR domain
MVMNSRVTVIGGAMLLAIAVALGAWWSLGTDPARDVAAAPLADPDLPVPPVPPRIASGADYERCLDMIATDAAGASALAETWAASGGGDGARHCRALAEIALGETETGAQLLEQLAATSHAPALARASVFGQAVQAWLIADTPDRAYGAATQALALAPDDPDLLIDRSIAAVAMNRAKDAITDLTRAIALDPGRIDALVLRATAWRQAAKLEQAKADIDRALEINPEFPEALLERGILRQRMDDRNGARADWEHAIALAPDSATADLAQQDLALLDAGPDLR